MDAQRQEFRAVIGTSCTADSLTDSDGGRGGAVQKELFRPFAETAVRRREAYEHFWAELRFAWERAWEPLWRAFSPVVWAEGGGLCG